MPWMGFAWENRFAYVWNPLFSRDGGSIAVSFQQDRQYGMVLNDVPWEETYGNLTDPALSPDGNHTAASVQVISTGEVEIHKFQEGTDFRGHGWRGMGSCFCECLEQGYQS